jgi:hypothetical protein
MLVRAVLIPRYVLLRDFVLSYKKHDKTSRLWRDFPCPLRPYGLRGQVAVFLFAIHNRNQKLLPVCLVKELLNRCRSHAVQILQYEHVFETV